MSSDAPDGELALVLHTHMPYVEGFGTWPFGEEWLWEAMATSYLPLLDLLESGAPLTLSLTPVLCDQLEADGVAERFDRFARELRRETHHLDAAELRHAGEDGLAGELERAAGDYQRAAERMAELDGDLLAALAPFAQWTSSATHAVLPLLASDAGVRLQVQAGIDAFRARFGEGWGGGFWLPECAHAPWLDATLADAGVHAVCVELTDRLGLGGPGHLAPLSGEAGLLLVPVDRATMSLVWSGGGYPSHPRYRDYHARTTHQHHAWANDGSPYDHAAALATARAHAADFVARALERLASARDGGGGETALLVCALDTELLGHWWYEGIAWLSAVVDEAARQGLAITRLDDALARFPAGAAGARDAPPWPATSWGEGRGLSTWSGPAVADLAWAARAAELRVVAAGGRAGRTAVRELLALQSSDWAFLTSRELAPSYGRERAEGHRAALDQLLGAQAVAGETADEGAGALRNLAVHADPALLLAP